MRLFMQKRRDASSNSDPRHQDSGPTPGAKKSIGVTRSAEIADVKVRARRAGISLIGESPQFLALLRLVERIARFSAPTVLIRGETGTGKELIARAIHYLGARRDFPFVPVNC